MKSTKVYLLLGSNLANREAAINEAVGQIEQKCGVILRRSSIYRSKAWGFIHQPDFFNIVLILETSLSPESLLQTLLGIEQEMGRTREGKWQSRLIDIDILFYGSEIIRQPGLQIPHPRIAERNFTLVPLMEIAPQLVHPTMKATIEELYLQSTDTLEVLMLEN